MTRNARQTVIPLLIKISLFAVACGLLSISFATSAVAQKAQALAHHETTPSQQPLYGDYKGVRIGTTAAEVHEKLGVPTQKGDDQDFYVISENVTAQIAYDVAHKVIAISVDYLDGVGAPDYRAVVGGDIETKPDGTMYKIVHYEKLGFWVSYHRSVGQVFVVSITIQKMLY
jgi:hypothetical protein